MNILKLAFRQLLKNSGFSTVACLCGARGQAVLTLGVRANTANSIPSSPFQAGKASGGFWLERNV